MRDASMSSQLGCTPQAAWADAHDAYDDATNIKVATPADAVDMTYASAGYASRRACD